MTHETTETTSETWNNMTTSHTTITGHEAATGEREAKCFATLNPAFGKAIVSRLVTTIKPELYPIVTLPSYLKPLILLIFMIQLYFC